MPLKTRPAIAGGPLPAARPDPLRSAQKAIGKEFQAKGQALHDLFHGGVAPGAELIPEAPSVLGKETSSRLRALFTEVSSTQVARHSILAAERTQLQVAASSLAGLCDWVEEVEPADPDHLDGRRQLTTLWERTSEVRLVWAALEVPGVRELLDPAVFERLASVEETLRADLAAVSKAVSQAQPQRPMLTAAQVQEPAAAAAAIGELLGNQGGLTKTLVARANELAPGSEGAKNLTALALLLDGALGASDYGTVGTGWHSLRSRLEYRERAYDPFLEFAAVPRRGDSRETFKAELHKALAGKGELGQALGELVTRGFLREVGLGPADAKDWEPSLPAVRDLLDREMLLPLRALNKVREWAAGKGWGPKVAHLYPPKVKEITRHMVEGDYTQWLRNAPWSKEQLRHLTPAQKEQWFAPTQVQVPTRGGKKLTTREEHGPERAYVTKIGGPSHGFDVGPECLMPLLANARTTPVLIDSPHWPHNAVGRAYLRLLETEDGKPVLYLEPLQVDFPYQAEGADYRDFMLALVRHAAAKAKQLGVPLSLEAPDPRAHPAMRMDSLVEQSGLKGKMVVERYYLAPSGGLVEASDTLARLHDWPQTEGMMSDALERLVILPPGQEKPKKGQAKPDGAAKDWLPK
jgi:hypothetical protein